MARSAPEQALAGASGRKNLSELTKNLAAGLREKKKEEYRLVLVTAPDLKIARRLATTALKKKMAACANLLPALESHYWWKGKMERAREVLILFKTPAKKVKALETVIASEHPYDTPEFITFRIQEGSRSYLEWLAKSVK